MNTKLLKQRILDLAIHGRLVPQNPDDEPASQLLRRISEEKEKLIAQGKIKRPKKSDAINPAQECPFEIPNSWEWVKLVEICEFLSRGKSPKYSEQRLYPVFAQKCNLKEGGISLEKALFLDPETLPKWSDHYKLRNGDVLINSTGTGTVCRTRLFHESCLGSYPFVVPDSHVSVVRTFESINSNYVYYFISASATQHYLEDNLSGSTNQKELGINVLDNLLIPLPPLAEQQRIVSAIEKWFSLIDEIETNKESLQAAIKQTKSKVLDLAIKGKLVKKTDEWKMVTLGEIGKWQAGGTPSRGHKEYYGGEIPWLKTGDLNDGFITEIPEHITQLGLEKSSAKLNPKDSVLIAMYGATIGKVGILTFPAATNQACCACTEYKDVDKMYLFYFLLSHREIFISQGGGGAQPNISKDIIVKTTIPLPPLSEQTRIVSKIEEVFALLDEIERELA